MGRYWRIYKVFFTSSLQRELEFRANFIAKTFQNCIWIVFFIVIVLVIYSRAKSIAGWNRGDAFALAATVFLMESISRTFCNSLIEIPEQVRRGTLDFVVTKPIDSQFWVGFRRFNFDLIGSIIAGIAMLVYGCVTSQANIGLPNIVLYAVAFLASVVIYNCFMMMLMTLGIWLVRVDNLWVLGETVQQVSRYPLDIYVPSVQRILTYGVPLAFIAYVPTQQLVKAPQVWPVLLGSIWAVLLFVAARKYWIFAMKHYSSASS